MVKGGQVGLSQGAISPTMLARSASIIAAMQKLAPPSGAVAAYDCPTRPAPSCKRYSLIPYKVKVQREFAKFFSRPVPKGLEGILQRRDSETRKFKMDVLDPLPSKVWICPANLKNKGK